jgi:hypothetical protein
LVNPNDIIVYSYRPYRVMKAVLDMSVALTFSNQLVYSQRKHLDLDNN